MNKIPSKGQFVVLWWYLGKPYSSTYRWVNGRLRSFSSAQDEETKHVYLQDFITKYNAIVINNLHQTTKEALANMACPICGNEDTHSESLGCGDTGLGCGTCGLLCDTHSWKMLHRAVVAVDGTKLKEVQP